MNIESEEKGHAPLSFFLAGASATTRGGSGVVWSSRFGSVFRRVEETETNKSRRNNMQLAATATAIGTSASDELEISTKFAMLAGGVAGQRINTPSSAPLR